MFLASPHPVLRDILFRFAGVAALSSPCATAMAQEKSVPQPTQQTYQAGSVQTSPGHLADSEVGEIGKRQTRDDEIGNIKPAVRINNRIANRVESRIRNRIDRGYGPQANTTSPFAIAAEKSRDTRQNTSR